MNRRVKDILRARQKRKEFDFDYGEPPMSKDEQIRKLWKEEVRGRPSKKKNLPPLVRKFRLKNV